mgnify:CR=1 FL=1
MNIIFVPGNRPIYIPVFSHAQENNEQEEILLIEQYFIQSNKMLKKAIKQQCKFDELNIADI